MSLRGLIAHSLRCTAAVLAALVCAAQAHAADVDIVLAEEGPAYAQAADAARREIGNRATVNILTLAAWERGGRKPDVVIALGNRALQGALGAAGSSAPVVATLLPRSAYERIVKGAKIGEARPVTAVFLDQPWSRQLNLVRTMLPGKHRVGVLATAEAEETVAPLRAAVREARMSLREEIVAGGPGDIHPGLARLLPETDALLAVPDSAVFNAGTLHNILVTTYRAQQPVFGFSAAYVRAGALAAVYSTPQQVGRQAGEAVARLLAGEKLPAPQHPRAFAVSVNGTVARSLELAVEDEAALAQKLARMESRE